MLKFWYWCDYCPMTYGPQMHEVEHLDDPVKCQVCDGPLVRKKRPKEVEWERDDVARARWWRRLRWL